MNRALNTKYAKTEGMNGVFRSISQENEALYAILNGLAEGVIIADKSGKFIFFNPVAEKILGIGSQDVPPNEWTAVYGCFYEDQMTPYPAEQLPLALTIHTHQFASDTLFIKNPAKPEGVFIFVSASPLFDPQGNFVGGMIVFRDISQIKQAENELKRSEEQARSQFKGFPIPAYVWQQRMEDFVLIDFNQAADVFTFGKIRELLGVKLLEFYQHSSDLSQIKNDFQQCFQQKKPIVREMSYLFQRSGIRKDLIVTYGFVSPDLILVHTQDITERKQAENEIKKLWNVVEQTADSIILTNKQGMIEYVNPAFEVTTGYTRAEAIGRTPQILKSDLHPKEFYQSLWEQINSGKPFRGTIINRKKDGAFYWSEQTITPMKDENGNITNFVSVLKDITELKEKQEQEFQLRIARELQQRFYRTAIHLPDFDIAGASYSAVETSGDYYDYISLPDGTLGIVIGDVSGHGIGPALIMAEVRAFLRAFAKHESDPAVLLTLLNQELVADLDSEHFVTLIFARLDFRNKTLDYASAGHVPAFILDATAAVRCKLPATGVPLGIIDKYKYEKSPVFPLNPRDLVVFLTDGVIETVAVNKQQFGFERTLEVIQQHHQGGAREIVEQLYLAVRDYSQSLPQEDDITSIVFKVLPAKK